MKLHCFQFTMMFERMPYLAGGRGLLPLGDGEEVSLAWFNRRALDRVSSLTWAIECPQTPSRGQEMGSRSDYIKVVVCLAGMGLS